MGIKTINLSKVNSKTLWEILTLFTREDLRLVAKKNKIPIGRNKDDVIMNLTDHKGKLRLTYITFRLKSF